MVPDSSLICWSHGLIPNPFFVVFFLRIFRERPLTIGKVVPAFSFKEARVGQLIPDYMNTKPNQKPNQRMMCVGPRFARLYEAS